MATMTASPIEQRAITTAEIAMSIAITSIEERNRAAEMGRTVSALDKEAEEFFAPMKESAHKTHKEICSKETKIRKPLEDAKRYLSGLIGAFDVRMEADRRAEEQRLQEQADQEAAEESKRISVETAISDAILLEEVGDKEGAVAVLNNPVPVPIRAPAIVLPRAVPKTEGVSTTTRWKFRITDEELIPREYLVVDEKAIGKVVEALKGKVNIPGIQAYPDTTARFRA